MSTTFEGPEKKLELTVSAGHPSLRRLGDEWWREVVRTANAEVLSKTTNGHCDAYLLSESSLFVWDDRVLLITCGQTRLVEAALLMLERVDRDQVEALIFERKNEFFPEQQPSTFIDDARRLNAAIEGRAFRLGDLDEHHLYVFHSNRVLEPDPNDVTLEVLMHGMDAEARSIFCAGDDHNAEKIHLSGVRDIIPGFDVDDYIFEPVGYSLNAIKDDEYYTIHVTPQDVGSYVSFETNQRFEPGERERTVQRMLEIFRPRSFDVILFEPRGTGLDVRLDYPLRSRVEVELTCGFDLSFAHFGRRFETQQPAFELEL